MPVAVTLPKPQEASLTEQRRAAAAPVLSVIIPVLNGGGVLPQCLDALNLSQHRAFEVLVVDDGSSDSTVQIAEAYGVRCIRNLRTSGPASARNLGAQHALGNILVFVDADVVLPPNALSLIEEDFDCNALTSAVFGSYDDEPASPTFISQYKNLMHHYIHQASRESASTFWAGCGAIRKSVFDEFGGFDAARYTEPTIEDVALGMELITAGHNILLDKRLTVKHLKKWTLMSLLKTDIFHRAVPWTRLILNSRHLPDDLNFDYTSRVSLVLVGLLALACLLFPIAFFGPWSVARIALAAGVAAIALLLVFLNRSIYAFFLRKRGGWFATRAVLAHWAYYLYGGITFLVVTAHHFVFGYFQRLKVTRAARAEKHGSS